MIEELNRIKHYEKKWKLVHHQLVIQGTSINLSTKFGLHPQFRHKRRQNNRGQYAIPSLLPCYCFKYQCTLYILNSGTANKTEFTVQTYITQALAFNLNKVLLIFTHEKPITFIWLIFVTGFFHMLKITILFN